MLLPPGTLQWMSKLQWPHLKDFNSAKRVPLYPYFGKVENSTGAFYQNYMNLNFFWILKAGHMVRARNCVGVYSFQYRSVLTI